MQPEADRSHTTRFVDLLRVRKPADLDWQRELDSEFLQAGFLHNSAQPYINGPDGWTYFAFYVPEEETTLTSPTTELDDMVHWVAGGAILTKQGQPLYVYSPGDIVSFKLFQTCMVEWTGRWNEAPDLEAYQRGGHVRMGMPSAEMLPPLVARSLEFGLRVLYSHYEQLKDRIPSICVLRLESHNHPEDPSELAVNATFEDFGRDEKEFMGFLNGVGRFLPRHLNRRLIGLPASLHVSDQFAPLEQIVRSAGLELAPVR